MGNLPARIKVNGRVYKIADRKEDYLKDKDKFIYELWYASREIGDTLNFVADAVQNIGNNLPTELESMLRSLWEAAHRSWVELKNAVGKERPGRQDAKRPVSVTPPILRQQRGVAAGNLSLDEYPAINPEDKRVVQELVHNVLADLKHEVVRANEIKDELPIHDLPSQIAGKVEYAVESFKNLVEFLQFISKEEPEEFRPKEDEPEEPLYYGASVKPKYIKVKGHLYRRAAGYNLDEDTGLEFPDIGYAEDGKPYPRKDPAVRGKDIAPSELIHTVLEALRAGPSGEKFVREVFLGKSTSLSSILDAIKEVQKQNLDSVGVSQGNAVSLFLKELDIISPRR